MSNNTKVLNGYDVWVEPTGETIEMFTFSLADAFYKAKKAFKSHGLTIAINRCKEECHLENDGTPYETVELDSYKTIAIYTSDGLTVVKD